MKYVSPSVRKTAFNCPNCDALAMQEWHTLLISELPQNEKLPKIMDSESRKAISFEDIDDPKDIEKYRQVADKLVNGWPVITEFNNDLLNVYVAHCFNCKEISMWIHEKLVFPQRGQAPQANPDLPDDIRRDYDEANSILDLSPRGSAALLRLAIQKLCMVLGLPGKNLNKDIGELVSKGLDQQVQMALDAVRVIGNNAVHPGQMDLRDDRSTAESLFELLNLIAERMISQPKRISDVYEKLPKRDRDAIENRDAGG